MFYLLLICKRRIVHGELLYADNVHDRISVQDYIGYMQQCWNSHVSV